jgi:Zn-dependent metalloprotease
MKKPLKFLAQIVIVLLGIVTTLGQSHGQEKFVYQNNQRINKRTNVVAAWYDVNSRVYQGTPEQIARQFLDENRHKFGIADLADLEFKEIIKSPAGHHVAFRQRYRGIPVFRSETVVSINHENQISMVINGHAPDIKIPNTTPRVAQSAAMSAVAARLQVDPKTFIKPPSAVLTIYSDSLETHHLAWKVSLIAGKPRGSWQAFVDAFSGEVISVYDASLPYVDGQGK